MRSKSWESWMKNFKLMTFGLSTTEKGQPVSREMPSDLVTSGPPATNNFKVISIPGDGNYFGFIILV